jgi:hypothetical protein
MMIKRKSTLCGQKTKPPKVPSFVQSECTPGKTYRLRSGAFGETDSTYHYLAIRMRRNEHDGNNTLTSDGPVRLVNLQEGYLMSLGDDSRVIAADNLDFVLDDTK